MLWTVWQASYLARFIDSPRGRIGTERPSGAAELAVGSLVVARGFLHGDKGNTGASLAAAAAEAEVLRCLDRDGELKMGAFFCVCIA